ncbi:MAG TPA: hypothetical protein VNF08_03705 [Acidimicrobiales bacterium]|nr:hypothetical protein [Acidimicrobiales bacterium]
MKWSRVVGSALVVVALGVGVSRASAQSRAFPVSAPCNAAALSAPYTGPLKVDSVASFGCVGPWAYLWATIGKGVEEISVTEVLRYEPTTAAWQNASRLTYCNHHLLPRYIEHWGCNSN